MIILSVENINTNIKILHSLWPTSKIFVQGSNQVYFKKDINCSVTYNNISLKVTQTFNKWQRLIIYGTSV